MDASAPCDYRPTVNNVDSVLIQHSRTYTCVQTAHCQCRSRLKLNKQSMFCYCSVYITGEMSNSRCFRRRLIWRSHLRGYSIRVVLIEIILDYYVCHSPIIYVLIL